MLEAQTTQHATSSSTPQVDYLVYPSLTPTSGVTMLS